MWVCRAGKDAIYFDDFIENQQIAVAWNGYKCNLSKIYTRDEFKCIVEKETQSCNATSIATWAGQLYSFCVEMKIGDYVMIPAFRSKYYVLAQIISEYIYDETKNGELFHYRKIRIICDNIERTRFPQNIQYSLGAFRTIFKTKNEETILEIANVLEAQ